MKTIISALLVLSAFGCSSGKAPDYQEDEKIERQEEVIQQEEESRTGQSDEMGPGFEYGTTTSPN